MRSEAQKDGEATGDRPSPGAITEELERLLGSPAFAAAERLRTFLRYVVEETLAGRAAHIKEHSVAVGAFGYDEAFDPQIDPYIRILARRLRRALSLYYATEGAASPVRIEMPKGGYVPTFLKAEPSDLHGVESSARPDIGAAASKNAGLSVAILRFDDLSEGHELAHITTGMAEALVVELARFSELRVVGPLDRAKSARPEEVGRSYGARFVLFGSAAGAGDTIRITVTLSDTSEQRCVWAQHYDRRPGESSLLDLQDEITHRVSSTIADSTGILTRALLRRPASGGGTLSGTYEAVLKAYHWAISLTSQAYRDALRSLEHAVEAAPRSALARALLSDLYLSDWLSAIGSTPDALDRAETLAEEAVRLDDRCDEAHWALGQVHFARRRPQRFRNAFERALAMNPNRATTLGSYALFLAALEDWDEALPRAETALCLNPHHPRWLHLVPFLHRYRAGDLDAAMSSAFELSTPGLMWEPLARAAILGRLGRQEEARPYVAQLLEIHPDFGLRADEYMGRLLWSPGHVRGLLDGLEAAGLPSPSTG